MLKIKNYPVRVLENASKCTIIGHFEYGFKYEALKKLYWKFYKFKNSFTLNPSLLTNFRFLKTGLKK